MIPDRLQSVTAGSKVAELELSREEKIDRLARVAVEIGVNVQEGQELVVTAPLDAYGFTRNIAKHAYRAGASLVTTLFTDDVATLLRFQHARDASFDHAAQWLHDGIAAAYRSGAARLAVTGSDPALLAAEDPGKVAHANLALSKATRPALELITRYAVNWSVVACATPNWARAVFPKFPENAAMARLWDEIFTVSRADSADPIATWQAHVADLAGRMKMLNDKRLSAIHFRGPGTDLRVGLADDHLWSGGAATARNGIVCVPNIPTEEVFTTPHRDRVEGTVISTKPLSYQGVVIEGIRVRFERGQIVEASADRGEAVLNKILETDAGARRLGEVALVPHSSPIASTDRLFWNTLFDENAASHIALGQAYSSCIQQGDVLEPCELAHKGANSSLIHIDWMIGSHDMGVDGLHLDGSTEPLMRSGEWV